MSMGLMQELCYLHICSSHLTLLCANSILRNYTFQWFVVDDETTCVQFEFLFKKMNGSTTFQNNSQHICHISDHPKLYLIVYSIFGSGN